MTTAKKVMIGVVAGALILGTSVSVHVSYQAAETQNITETKHVKDSRGGDYEVTHKIDIVDGQKSELYQDVPCEIVNETGEAITGLYIACSTDDTWGDNLLVMNGENFSINDGDRMWGMTLSYMPDVTVFDIKIDKEDGTTAEFTGCSMSGLEDPMHIEMDFYTNEDGTQNLWIG